MPSVIEFTMKTLPGKYAEVVRMYEDFADTIIDASSDAEFALITGDPASGTVRGIGVWDDATTAATAPGLPVFEDFMTAVSPHLEEAPERVELQLLHVHARH